MAFIDFDGDRRMRMVRNDWGFEAFKDKIFLGFAA